MKVLFLVAGGLRLDALGCYGNQRLATPAFDRLAAEGVVFDHHLADEPSAAGARRAWRTGQYHFDDAAPPENIDLYDLLRAGRVATAQIQDEEALVEAVHKFRQADHALLQVELNTALPPWPPPPEIPAPLPSADEDEDDLDEDDEPHDEIDDELEEPDVPPVTDPTPGIIDPNDDMTRLGLAIGYGLAVERLDQQLGRLLEIEGLDEFLVIVTSDHGYPLGEQGLVGEVRPWLFEERIHLPLIVRQPGLAQAGLRVACLTQHVDLAPTLLEALGQISPAMHRQSLWPLLRGEATPLREYACSSLAVGADLEWALQTPEWHFILPVRGEPPRPPRLHVKPDDRWEANDVRQHHLERAEALERTLRAFAEAVGRPGPFRPPPLEEPILAGATS